MRTLLALVAASAFLYSAPPAWAMELKSADVSGGARIALEQVYTRCGGKNVSPALAWSGAPAGTKSYALTLIDQDVKPALWSHWIVIDLPASTTSLAKGASLPAGAKALTSDFGEAAYDGPCPPPGSGAHHYRFTVWAMREATISPPTGSAAALQAWLKGHAAGSASLTATFER